MATPKESYIADYLALMLDMLNKESANYPYSEEKFATLYADIIEAYIKKVPEDKIVIISGGVNQTLDMFNYSIFSITMTDNLALTLSNPIVKTYVVKCLHHPSSSYTVTFPNSYGVGSNVVGNTIYTLAAGEGNITLFYIFYDGTNFFISENPFTA